MNEKELTDTILKVLTSIAPEAADVDLDPRVGFRDQLDFDSMDFLNFAIGLHEELGVDIPPKDYPRLATLASAVTYLQSRLGG
jgi:acyl carrier protein